MRLIDADALFKDICDSINEMTKIGIMVDGEWLWAKLNDALENAPTIKTEPQWTPCSERLPEENGEYLVTRESSSYRYIDIVRKSNCNSHLPMASDIKAWMPLPEPWKG